MSIIVMFDLNDDIVKVFKQWFLVLFTFEVVCFEGVDNVEIDNKWLEREME